MCPFNSAGNQTVKNLKKFPLLVELYKNGEPLCKLKFNEGVRGISPRHFDVLRAVRFASKCEQHKSSNFNYTHVLFCRSIDYTDIVGPGIYLGSYVDRKGIFGIIFGQMNNETQEAFDAGPLHDTKLKCGCYLERIPDEEVPALIVDKNFICSYVNGHLIDER